MAKKSTRGGSRQVRLSTLPYELESRVERPAHRRSIHKARAAWFQARAAWPLREPDIGQLVRERQRAASTLPVHTTSGDWALAGPTNIGGRMTSLVSDPADADHIWAGAAGGGVWESTDAGLTWATAWLDEPSLNIGALAIDPQDPLTIYCGTGEANLSADSYAGVGVYRTTDGGQTWQLLAPAETAAVPTRIGVIVVDPFDSQHLLLGGISYAASGASGLFESTDGGQTWIHHGVLSGSPQWCHSIAFDPAHQGTIYATFTEQGSGSGVYKTQDGGQSWQKLTAGLPLGFFVHRAAIAVSPSHPHILYLQVADAWSDGNDVLGVYRSNNGGVSWTEVGGNHFRDERQMSYNNTIAVHPLEPDRVICGGVDLHRSTDDGATWHQVTQWFEDPGSPSYAHADQHALHIPPADPDRIYAANDGGVDVSYDRGRSWRNRSQGLSITMYYDLEVSQLDSRLFGGGSQDNGTLVTVTGQADDHFDITGGDGGWIIFDPNEVGHIYASIYNMNIFRHRNQQWVDVTPRGATPAEEAALAAERESMWMVFLAIDPDDSDTVFTGTQRVWRTENDGVDWEPVSNVLDGSDVTAIEVARADTSVVYVGTENGGFYRSTDGGDTWQGNLATAVLPGRTITRIASRSNDADTVFVTVANRGNSHVFRSEDGGTTWADVDQGALPDAPFHSIAYPASRPHTVFVCGDAGVFVSTDLGQSWKQLTKNLPNTILVDLVFHEADSTLSAATYGRSIWRLRV